MTSLEKALVMFQITLIVIYIFSDKIEKMFNINEKIEKIFEKRKCNHGYKK